MNNGIIIAGVISLIMATIADVATAASVRHVTATHLEPVVLLRNGAISACGLKADGRSGTFEASIALTLYADPTRPTGTRMVVAGTWSDAAGTAASETQTIVALKFKTATVNVSVPPSALTTHGGGPYHAIIELNALDGAQLFRETLLAGAIATLEAPDGAAVDLTIWGPAPHSVRAAYLNCAGDLFRPEAASQSQP